jgi:uncharacterized membrane protein YeaQ/YmgE (transglycosylase-associated protein family)
MDLTTILIQLIAGAVGGNAAGLLNKAKSLGPLLNTVLGIIGGVGGGQLLGGPVAGMLGGNATAGNATSAAVIGALLPLVVGLFKKPAA